jgi:hypothetical protein
MVKEFDPTLGYLMFFNEHGTFDADKGKVDYTKEEADEHNRIYDQCLVEGLDQCPVGKGGYFYINKANGTIQTFIGTKIADIESRFGKLTARTVRFKRNGMTFSGRYNSDKDECCFFVRKS